MSSEQATSAAHADNAPVLEIRHVSKHFGAIRALDDISFVIRRGEILGLVGDNGAGKSTLVKIISGVHQPTSGEVLLDGAPIFFETPAEARAAGIETVYQDLALVDNLDVAANFFLGREAVGSGWRRLLGVMRIRDMQTEAHAGIEDLHVKIPGIREAVSEMSGGQRQAVAIARAAFWKRKLLLLDEPTAALGVEESGEVMRVMKEMSRQEIPMLVISHNMEEVWNVCHRILVLRQGQQVTILDKAETSPEEIVGYITGALAKRRLTTNE